MTRRHSMLIALVLITGLLVGCNVHDENLAPASIGAPYTGPLPRHDDQKLGALAGTVVAAKAEGPVPTPGATIVAVEQGGSGRTATATTDQGGDFILARLPAGRWKLGCAAPGLASLRPEAPSSPEFVVEAGRVQKVGTLTVRPAIDASVGCRITGRLSVAAGMERSLAQVRIEIPGVDGPFSSFRIDPASGRFEVILPATGDARVRTLTLAFVSPSHYLALAPGVTVFDGGRIELPADVALRSIVSAD